MNRVSLVWRSWAFYLISCMLLCVAYARVADDNNGYRIEGRIILDGTSLKSSEVKVILDGGEHVAPLRTNGVFAFSDVPSGTHLLEVIALGHVFRAVRLDVTQGAVHAYTADSMQLALPYPLRLKASAQVYYFEKYSSFSYMSLLKNPMVLMGLGLVVIMMLPKLVDPEALKEMQKEMGDGPSAKLARMMQQPR